MDIALFENELVLLKDNLNTKFGLNFLVSQENEMMRKVSKAADELGFLSVSSFVQWLVVNTPDIDQTGIIAKHLTIGETYFMREKKGFDFLEQIYIPDLISKRKNRDRRLNVWCAGCATGEEAYSLAITLFSIIPDIEKWRISILATDINPKFLEKAKKAEYTKWSFRNISPDFKTQYFEFVPPDKFRIKEPFKSLVDVVPFNLASKQFNVLLKDNLLFDIIFCRNVLIYFSPEVITSVTNKFFDVLSQQGILIVSPVEVSSLICNRFNTVLSSGLTVYKKEAFKKDMDNITAEKMPKSIKKRDIPNLTLASEKLNLQTHLKVETDITNPSTTKKPDTITLPYTDFVFKTKDGQKYLTGDKTDETPTSSDHLINPDKEYLLKAKERANLGKLKEAELLCEKAIVDNKLDPAIYYLLATILQEQGDDENAIQNLKIALYLDPDFILAHFLLGTLAIKNRNYSAGKKSFKNALAVMSKLESNEILPESDGMTVAHFKEMIDNIGVKNTKIENYGYK